MAIQSDDPIKAEHLEPAEQRGPQGKRRRRIRLLLWTFVALQMAIPLTYYMRDDPYDERFAWRMFSAIRVHACEARASERVGGTSRELVLSRVMHVAWINHLRRNRLDVVRAFLERRCEEKNVERVRLVNRCRAADGSALKSQIYERECASGEESVPDPDEWIEAR